MKALVLAAGLPQVALIQDIKSRGIGVVLADYTPEPIAKSYADTFYQISTLDIPAITKIAKKEQVDFVTTVCTDQALLTVAKVSQELELPCYIDYQTGLNVTNKSYMKKVFAEQEISTAQFVSLEKWDAQAVAHLRYPLIVKPVDCNSSKGVKRVDDAALLKEAFESAVCLSRTNSAIIEEYIVGDELSVDVYVEQGIAHILAISQLDKIPEKDKFIIFRSKYPDNLTEVVRKKIQHTAQQIADAFQLKNSPMLIQMISDGSNVFVLEFSARTGGGEKFIMINRLSGFDTIKAVVDLTLGKLPHVEPHKVKPSYFASEFIYCKPGIFERIEGDKILLQNEVISDFYYFKTRGTQMGGIYSSGDRVAGYSIIANTKEELEHKHTVVLNTLKVLDCEGNNIMRYDLLPDVYGS